jgi:tripartite-type tricarboxylate transporter receptor subunit TctC
MPVRRVLSLLLCLLPLPAVADWPNKPVKVVVPFAAGGATEVVARAASEHLSRVFGQPFILDNRSGGSGVIGTEIVTKSPPDGYTLLVTTIPPIAMVPHMRKLAYDPLKDLAPVSRITESMPLLAVHPSLGVKTFAEFVALAKAKPGTIHYGSAGQGSITHLRGAILAKQAGIDIVQVPYKGGAETLVDVLAGNIDAMLDGAVVPYVKSGKLNLIVTLDTVRHPAFPDTPTVREAGLPEYEAANWVGMLAPAGIHPNTVKALARELQVVARNKELAERLIPMSQRLVEDSPESMAASIRQQYDLYARVFKELDIRAE